MNDGDNHERHLSNFFGKTVTVFPDKSYRVVCGHRCSLRSGPWEKGQKRRGDLERIWRETIREQVFTSSFETQTTCNIM